MLCQGFAAAGVQLSAALVLPALSRALASTQAVRTGAWCRSFATASADTNSKSPGKQPYAFSQTELKDSTPGSEQAAAASEQAAAGSGQEAGTGGTQNALKHTTGGGMRTTPLCRLTGLCGRTATRIIDTNMRCPVCLMDRSDRGPTTFFPAVSIDETVRLRHTSAAADTSSRPGNSQGGHCDGTAPAAAGAATNRVRRSTTPAFAASGVAPSLIAGARYGAGSSAGISCRRHTTAACGASEVFPTHIRVHIPPT